MEPKKSVLIDTEMGYLTYPQNLNGFFNDFLQIFCCFTPGC